MVTDNLRVSALTAYKDFLTLSERKLNPAKSTPPAPKSDTAMVEADENGLKFNEDLVDDKGETHKLSYEAKFDGKDYRVTGAPDADSISYQRLDAHARGHAQS